MNERPLELQSARAQAAAVASGEISAVELLDRVLVRYERHNPEINAVIVTRIDDARERAAAADAATAAGESWGPLHGVPITVKEAFDWEGTPTTWGMPALRDNIADTNAVAVDRLLGAGAVLYGKTNVPYGLADWQSFNEIYGTTNNPWDLTRVPGGSSGGSAAALATGMSSLEFGSDIGASIRNPAHYCGVFGHKPTFSLIPDEGHRLPGQYHETDIAVVGPLARTAGDLDLALQLTAGPTGMRARGHHVELEAIAPRDPSAWRVAVQFESPVLTQDVELTAQLQVAVEQLVAAGVQVDETARPDIDQERAWDVYTLMLRSAASNAVPDEDYAAHVAAGERWENGDRDYRARLGKGISLSHREWLDIHNEREHQRLKWDEFFDDYDLLLCPIAASAAFPHDHEGERADRTIPINDGREPVVDQLFWAGWSCGVFLPGTVAPAGLTASGLPCGLQIVAPHLRDRRGIAFAQLMEDVVGGWIAPPGVEP